MYVCGNMYIQIYYKYTIFVDVEDASSLKMNHYFKGYFVKK